MMNYANKMLWKSLERGETSEALIRTFERLGWCKPVPFRRREWECKMKSPVRFNRLMNGRPKPYRILRSPLYRTGS